jgi:hypothetical protein
VLSNIGLKLEPDELNTIFEENVRGRKALDLFPTEGSGFGLWYAQQSMQAWRCDLMHKQRPLMDDSDMYAWHDFTLCFKKRMISRS